MKLIYHFADCTESHSLVEGDNPLYNDWGRKPDKVNIELITKNKKIILLRMKNLTANREDVVYAPEKGIYKVNSAIPLISINDVLHIVTKVVESTINSH